MKKEINLINLSVIIISLATSLITILAELFKNFKESLTYLTGHHWITKSVLSIFIFLSMIFINPIDKKKKDVWLEIKKMSLIVALSTLFLFLFFVWEFFK